MKNSENNLLIKFRNLINVFLHAETIWFLFYFNLINIFGIYRHYIIISHGKIIATFLLVRKFFVSISRQTLLVCIFIDAVFSTIVRTIKLMLHWSLRRATRNQSVKRRNRIIRPLSEVARGGSTKTPQRSSQLSNLRQRIAEIRKFETFERRVQKKGAGDSGNCKTTSAPGINFHNERAQCYAVWQTSSQTRLLFWNIQASSSSFAIPLPYTGGSGASNPSLADRFLSSDFL